MDEATLKTEVHGKNIFPFGLQNIFLFSKKLNKVIVFTQTEFPQSSKYITDNDKINLVKNIYLNIREPNKNRNKNTNRVSFLWLFLLEM